MTESLQENPSLFSRSCFSLGRRCRFWRHGRIERNRGGRKGLSYLRGTDAASSPKKEFFSAKQPWARFCALSTSSGEFTAAN